jgi:putative tryptophan/tyrosine transport system substrate-binding protein
MRRREFIVGLGGVAAWPAVARAQQSERLRRVGLLMNRAADDAAAPGIIRVFNQALTKLGWTIGRNVRIEYRWGANDADLDRRYAAELADLAPDVIVAAGTESVAALQRVAPNMPIVFVTVTDPVGAGFVDSLAQPGGNTTGFSLFEYSLSGKWLELLKQIAPGVKRAAILRDPTISVGIGQFAVIQAVAPSLGVDVKPVNIQAPDEIERAVATVARSGNGGMVVTASALAGVHRDLIRMLTARYKLPSVYPFRSFVDAGGLASYGPNFIEPYRQAANYVDRILKGEKPADLPVQAPTKYELVINLKTAKALGLDVPPQLLARADEVIE